MFYSASHSETETAIHYQVFHAREETFGTFYIDFTHEITLPEKRVGEPLGLREKYPHSSPKHK